MKRLRVLPACSALLMAFGAAGVLSANPIFTLVPTGFISGADGSTVGWGFTIGNVSDYVEITSSQFCADTFAFPICDSPVTGAYNDFIGPNDVIVGPADAEGTGPGVSQTFDPVALTGAGSFLIGGPGAITGASDTGQIVLTYNLWSVDPNDPAFDPVADFLGSDLVLSANASVTVTAATPPGIPEPGTAGMFAFALAAVGLGRYALRRRRAVRPKPSPA